MGPVVIVLLDPTGNAGPRFFQAARPSDLPGLAYLESGGGALSAPRSRLQSLSILRACQYLKAVLQSWAPTTKLLASLKTTHLPHVFRNFRRFRYRPSNRAVPYCMYSQMSEAGVDTVSFTGASRGFRKATIQTMRTTTKDTILILSRHWKYGPTQCWAAASLTSCTSEYTNSPTAMSFSCGRSGTS